MNLQVTREESEALALALTSYLSDLRMEIAATDRKEFRDPLKERELQLVSILAKLETLLAPIGAWPYEPAPDVDAPAESASTV